MTNTGTYVRLLRHLGIALIFAPEPFTTPFGVAFVIAARYLSKRHEASVNDRLREMVRYYLAHAGHSSDCVHDESGTPSPTERRGLTEEHPILGQITGSRDFGARSSVRQGRRDVRQGTANHTADMGTLSRRSKSGHSLTGISTRTQKVTHHTGDMEWPSRRYENPNGAVARSGWTTTSGSAQGVTQHSINMGLLSGHYGTGNTGQMKAKSHTTDITRRRQRCGSSVGRTTVLNAIQNNNYYYDMSSRSNVIGVY